MCTNFHLKARDRSIVVGRAMDYSLKAKPYFMVRNRNSVIENDNAEIESKANNKDKNNEGKYGYVALSVKDFFPGVSKKFAIDGMNEAGLSACFAFLRGTEYQSASIIHPSKNIFAPSLCSWVLANYATVAEVKKALPKYNVFFSKIFEKKMPLYLAVTDKKGNSAVIEFIDKEMKITDNPVGVSTNEPPFEWHLNNLSLYQTISCYEPKGFTVNDFKCEPFENLGVSGLPGDMASPSRFIRVAYAKNFSRQPKNSEEAYCTATHLLNMVDSPAGLTRSKDNEDTHQRWCVIKGLGSGIMAVRTYDTINFAALDLKKINFRTVKDTTFPVPEIPLMTTVTLPA